MDNRRVAWSSFKREETGRLIQFIAFYDSNQWISPHAIIEMADGRVKVLELHDGLDFRFTDAGGEGCATTALAD